VKSGVKLLQGVIKFQFDRSAIPEKVCGAKKLDVCFPS